MPDLPACADRNGKDNDSKNRTGMREKLSFSDKGKRYDSFRYNDSTLSGKKKQSVSGNRKIHSEISKTDIRKRENYRPSKVLKTEPLDKAYINESSEENYILTGRNPIREALKTKRDLEKLLVQKGDLSGSAMEIVKTAKERKIMIQVVDKSRLDEISPRHQGLIAFASAFRYSS